MADSVCVLILNWNGKEDTRECLCSIKELSFQDKEVVVIDNGSSDDSVKALREEFPHLHLIETGENLGYAGGNNVGLQYALEKGFSHVLILNNDTVVAPDLIERFLEVFRERPDVGIAGGRIYLMEQQRRFDHFGGQWNRGRIDFDYIAHREMEEAGRYEEVLSMDYACGAALMVKREVLEKVGLFEPRFFLFWEETDFCFRARRAGFEVVLAPHAKVWHKVSASFTGGKPHATYFFWRNRLLFIERNFSGLERALYFGKLVIGNGGAMVALKVVRGSQLLLQKALGKKTARNEERLRRCDAALCGMRDYLKRSFGVGSSTRFHQ